MVLVAGAMALVIVLVIDKDRLAVSVSELLNVVKLDVSAPVVAK